MSVHILDCTLRDGGYNNDWNFGEKSIKSVIQNLTDSSVDVIECGFLSQVKKSTNSNAIFNDFFELNKYLPKVKSRAKYVCMINYGEYPIEKIPNYDGEMGIDGIRVAFHKKDFNDSMDYCRKLISKGYAVYLQPMVTQNYTDSEILKMIDVANELNPLALYIVDSFGIMKKKDVMRFLYIIDNALNPNIVIGFHSHNNLQLSFSNAQELIEYNTKRDILIDSSVMGMGRGAGNLCTELLAQYLNEMKGSEYNLIPILRTVDEYINPIFMKCPWGYTIPYYIAAINGCHPNYATYLSERQMLSVEDINFIVKSIDDKRKGQFDKEYIEKLYLNFQNSFTEDSKEVERVRSIIGDREVLVLAPGKSLATNEERIREHIEKNNPIVISVNFYPDFVPVDIVFVSNSKRTKRIMDSVKEKPIIHTSNVRLSDDTKNTIKINYSDYLVISDGVIDNSGLMLTNLLEKINVKKITLAGFDGYVSDRSTNYFTQSMVDAVEIENLNKINLEFTKRVKHLRNKIPVIFLTDSRYDV